MFEDEDYESLAELLDAGAKQMCSSNPRVWTDMEKARGAIWDWMTELKKKRSISTGTGGFILYRIEDDGHVHYELMQHIVDIYDEEYQEGEPEGYDWTKRGGLAQELR